MHGISDIYQMRMHYYRVIKCILFQLADQIWASEKKDRAARKVIVYFTDARVHSGRDGSIGGILTPAGND